MIFNQPEKKIQIAEMWISTTKFENLEFFILLLKLLLSSTFRLNIIIVVVDH